MRNAPLIKLAFQIAISLLLLVASLYILISPLFLAESKLTAAGFIGLVAGYWLK